MTTASWLGITPANWCIFSDTPRDELGLGVVREESRAAYRDVIQRLVDAGARGIVLGCTEIELLIGPDDSPVPTFPTTRLHVEAAVEAALSDGHPDR